MKIQRIDILPPHFFEHFEILKPDTVTKVELPLFSSPVYAGFPSPADDHLDKKIDLNDYLIHNRSATFLIRAIGDSMRNCGIWEGDLMIVDRSVKPMPGHVVIGVLYGDFTCKRIMRKNGKAYLQPENDEYAAVEITEEMNFRVWGVVTFSIRDHAKNLRAL